MAEDLGPYALLKNLGDGRVIDDFYEQLGMLLMTEVRHAGASERSLAGDAV